MEAIEMVRSSVGVLSRLWTDRCDVIVRRAVTRADGSTAFEDAVMHTDVPCRMSYFQSRALNDAADDNGAATELRQMVKIILPVDIEIAAGSRFRLRRGERTMEFRAARLPMVFGSHQEIVAENADRWA